MKGLHTCFALLYPTAFGIDSWTSLQSHLVIKTDMSSLFTTSLREEHPGGAPGSQVQLAVHCFRGTDNFGTWFPRATGSALVRRTDNIGTGFPSASGSALFHFVLGCPGAARHGDHLESQIELSHRSDSTNRRRIDLETGSGRALIHMISQAGTC